MQPRGSELIGVPRSEKAHTQSASTREREERKRTPRVKTIKDGDKKPERKSTKETEKNQAPRLIGDASRGSLSMLITGATEVNHDHFAQAPQRLARAAPSDITRRRARRICTGGIKRPRN